jgi:predicted helicase
MNALRNLLTHFCQSAQSEREKGTYFEDLTLKCFAHEPKYRDLYGDAADLCPSYSRSARLSTCFEKTSAVFILYKANYD